ncbi:MAG: mercuric reductase [Deltaproteobacteria bacterium]|nr:mercuric reductase [Deltaproteobacteria bacterium]MBW2446260.1 mercuric reductase [Deltaproteobacteria bacterium]
MSANPSLVPGDPHDDTLAAHVSPADWKNPEPADRYNLVILGAGTAGLITAAVAAGLGARVALVERHMMGGDCLNVGCVPSKGVIRESRRAHEARSAAGIGLPASEPADVDFAAAMERMRARRAHISEEDSAARYQNELGVDVFLGEARFAGGDIVEVDTPGSDTTKLRFKKAVIATGARAAAPPIPGLAEAGYRDNETIFALTERPQRLGVIGSGPIGCELAQAFRRLGCEVVLFEQADRIMTREDPDAAAVVQQAFEEEGIETVLGCQVESIRAEAGAKVVRITCSKGTAQEYAVDEILVGVGRAPNVEGLNLEAVGVEYERYGVKVDDALRTANPAIYAAGDVCMRWKFTHAADATAKIVVRNTLFPFLPKQKTTGLVMPWCTYTDPEVAHVGMYEADAREQGIEVDTIQIPLERVNRAVLDGDEGGFVKVHLKKGTDKILGATIVASHAGEMISEITLAMVAKLGLGTILNVIHPYPTQAEAIKRAAGEHARGRLTPTVAKIFERIMAWSR